MSAPTAEGDRHRQFFKFLAVGALNTLFGYGVFSTLIVLGMNAGLSLFIATLSGVLFNFFSTGRLVFASREIRRLPYFAAVYGLTFLINLWCLKILTATGLRPLLGQAMLLPVVTVLSFALNKIFVFRYTP